MAPSPRDIDTILEQKGLALEAEIVNLGTDGADMPHHKSKLEKRLIFKQDISIVVLLSGCYWFAYLVRPGAISRPSKG